MLVESPMTTENIETTTAPLVRVVDDEPSIRNLFERIGKLCGFEVECHATGTSFLDSFEHERPGCVVIDLMLPDISGIDVLEQVSRDGNELPVVFISGMARVSEAVQALKLGSIDFVEKPFDVHQIADILRRAVSLDLRRRQTGADHEQTRQRFESLTPRERQVMEQIVRGAANKEVAAKLGLSHKTVEVHRANVMRKTQAGSLAELVRMHVAMNARDTDRS